MLSRICKRTTAGWGATDVRHWHRDEEPVGRNRAAYCAVGGGLRGVYHGLAHRVRPELAIGPARGRTRWACPIASSGRTRWLIRPYARPPDRHRDVTVCVTICVVRNEGAVVIRICGHAELKDGPA